MQESKKTEIREIRPEDTEELVRLWHEVFADPEELAACFLRLLPGMGGGVCAIHNGQLAGAAYVVTGFTVGELRAGYLYAIAVHPAYRSLGLGKALTRAAAALGKNLGADFLCTLPANQSLYGWYEGLIGLRCTLYRKVERFASKAGLPVAALDAAEYNARREALLRGTRHMTLSDAAAEFERFSCCLFGGALYAVGDGIAAAYQNDEGAYIRELLCPDPAQRRAYAEAVGAAMGCESVTLLSPGTKEDRPFLMAEPGALPEARVWNLAFD